MYNCTTVHVNLQCTFCASVQCMCNESDFCPPGCHFLNIFASRVSRKNKGKVPHFFGQSATNGTSTIVWEPLVYITRSVVLLITVHLVYTVLVFIDGPWGEARAPTQKILLASLWGEGAHAPQNFYRIHNDLESLFKKNKQFLQNLFKIFLKFSKITIILDKFCKIFLIFPTNHP